MELKEYIKVLKKNLVLILSISLLGAVLGALATKSLPEGYAQTQTLFIKTPASQNQQNTGFYNQEQSRNFTDTAVAILQSPDFQNQVTQSGSIRVKKLAPQVITITTVAKNPQDTAKISQDSINSFNIKLGELTEDPNPIQLKRVGNYQDPTQIQANTKLFTLAGLIVGFAFATLAASLKTYFRL